MFLYITKAPRNLLVGFLFVAGAMNLWCGCGGSAGPEEPAESGTTSEEAPSDSTAVDDPSLAGDAMQEGEKAGRGGRRAGRWQRIKTPILSEEQQQRIADLEAIGYVSGSEEVSRSGVTVHKPRRTCPGFNLYTSGHAAEAQLFDRDGDVRHRWRMDFTDIWPEEAEPSHSNKEFWRRAYLLEDGSLLAIFEGLGVIKLDRDSNLIWSSRCNAHHDLQIMDNGDICVLTRRAHMVPWINEAEPIQEDLITWLDADGKEKSSFSLLEAMEKSDLPDAFPKVWRNKSYLFHTNTLEVLDGGIADAVPAFEKGNYLVSMLTLNQLVVVDCRSEKVVWVHRGAFRGQHDSQILPSGKLLFFDNRGGMDSSRIVELDPATRDIHWEYIGTKEAPFFSENCGTVQRLPNGNTLITESTQGRAFEVGSNKRIVWEFYNPHRAGKDGQFIATLFSVTRYPESFVESWLEQPD